MMNYNSGLSGNDIPNWIHSHSEKVNWDDICDKSKNIISLILKLYFQDDLNFLNINDASNVNITAINEPIVKDILKTTDPITLTFDLKENSVSRGRIQVKYKPDEDYLDLTFRNTRTNTTQSIIVTKTPLDAHNDYKLVKWFKIADVDYSVYFADLNN